MDNYSRLFNESRPLRVETDGKININPEEINKMVNSEWLKNKELGVKAYKEQNYTNAIHFLSKAIQENPNNSHLYSVRANIKEDSGDLNGAINDFKKALFIGNDWYATYNQIAQNYYKIQEFRNALIAFDIAIELKKQTESEGLENNLSDLMDGVVIREKFEIIYTNRATIKLNLKDYQGCEKDCRKAIEVNPNYSNSYFILGVLFLTLEHMSSANEFLKIAANKGNSQAINLLNQYF